MRTYVYLRPQAGARSAFHEGQASRPDAKSAEAFLESRGVSRPDWREESDLRRPLKWADRATGRELLSVLREGDMLVVPLFEAGWDFPSDASSFLQVATGRGIDLRILDLTSEPASTLIPMLRALGTAYHPLEQALRASQKELGEVQARAEVRLQAAMSEAIAQIVKNWGPPPALAMGISPLGDVTQPLPPTKGQHVGAIIKAKREGAGLSQRRLAAEIGVSQPTVARLESGHPDVSQEVASAAFQHLFGASEPKGDSHAVAA